jgi:hypothetical protein
MKQMRFQWSVQVASTIVDSHKDASYEHIAEGRPKM